MSRNTWLIFIGICVLILGGLILMSSGDRTDVANVNENQIQQANEDENTIGDHVFGNPDADVVIIEYADFQCPGCRTAAPVLKAVAEQYQDDIAFVYRHFPLSTIHPNARAAAAAAEAAGLQDKFWEMNELLYETQGEWSNLGGNQRTDRFVEYAANLELDTEKFRNDLTISEVTTKINFDAALGQKKNVTGTPTIFLNGENVSDRFFSGDELVERGAEGAQQIWSDAEAFGNLIVRPAIDSANDN